VCLSDDGVSQEVDEIGHEEEHVELNANVDVDNLLNHLSEEWQKEQIDSQANQVSASKVQPSGEAASAEASVADLLGSVQVPYQGHMSHLKGTSQHNPGPVSIGVEGGDIANSRQPRNGNIKKAQQTSSCPPGRVHMVSAGPWSLEWVQRHKDVVIGDASNKVPNGTFKSTSGAHRVIRKKGSGYLRHCAQNLKRIVRLSDEDRKQVLRALRKTHRRCKVASGASKDKLISNDSSFVNGSQNSVNNDWTNWLVLHGNDKVLSDDVRDIGKAVGLNFQGDKNNMFDVLSGAVTKNKEGDGNGQ